MIRRDDMLELTRRMTVKRNCFVRIAGAYMDAEGYIDGTFNVNFLNLSGADKAKNIEIAKAIPFALTNDDLKEYRFPVPGEKDARELWKLLHVIKESKLKNDALMETFYEIVGERYRTNHEYAIYMFYGVYDVPLKGADKARQWESEEVYEFIICTICPLVGDYEPGEPEWGFLYPAFVDRSGDPGHIDVYRARGV